MGAQPSRRNREKTDAKATGAKKSGQVLVRTLRTQGPWADAENAALSSSQLPLCQEVWTSRYEKGREATYVTPATRHTARP